MSRLSISQVALGTTDFEEQLQAIADSGAAGVGLFDWCFLDGMDAREIRRRVSAAGLKPTICGGATSFVLPTPFPLSPSTPRTVEESVRETIASIERFAPLEPACFVVITGGQGDLGAEEARATVIEALGRINDRAKALGVLLALEPVHPRWPAFSLVSSVDEARELLDQVGDENIGLLVDTFHVWTGDDVLHQIARAAGRITAVHLSDSSERPRNGGDRLLPGDGVIDLRAFIDAIEATGYDGWYDFEIASDPEYEDSFLRFSPPVIARKCADWFRGA